jgi:tripartite ATP-independent transporter DctM subunit
VADLASVGKIGLKSMRDAKYPDNLSLGVIISASTIGPIIPPSINMVIFGSIANVPIGLLFLGGVVPGILTGIMIMMMFAFLFWRRKVKVQQPAAGRGLWAAFREAFWSLMTPVVLLGAMFSGIATPTEAAIVATVYTLVVAGLIYRELTWAAIFEVLLSTALVSGAILVIIGFAAPLGYVIAREQVAVGLSTLLVGSFQGHVLLLFAVVVVLLVIGCFMEVVAALILLTPVLGAALIATGLDPVFVGVLMVYTLGIGLVTPPVGMCLYVGSQISGVRLEKVVAATAPFILPLAVTMVLMILFPSLITWLPNAVYAK